MANDSTFGAPPERLRRLLIFGRDESDEHEQPTASWDILNEKPGSQIGRYRLVRLIGEGGMGMVYLAEQEHPIKRQVALKIIKPGMDSKRIITRFEAERQALAQLDHPNIAHVYDAGMTEVGRPYFVMEYVEGLSITEYCDHHKLTIEERLRLFQQVCLAIQHAHQKGIIHRDIKPSNILVSVQEDPAVPKIIDFGVAKALAQPLTEGIQATEDSQLLGAPEYMSPEQAGSVNEDIDTRSDVYSLGVLLYVILTGVLPFEPETLREGGIENIRQVIRETDPKTPSTRLSSLGEEAAKVAEMRSMEISTLTKHLRNELEWIPLKAMRKVQSERYRSASELADDIENYIKGVPLIAGPPSNVYRFKKFVRRNRALVTGIAAVFVVLISGVVGITIFAIKAEQRRVEAQAIADFLVSDLITNIEPLNIQNSDLTIHSFLSTVFKNVSENLEAKLANQPLVEASIRTALGWRCYDLGNLTAAEQHFRRAFQLREEHLGPEHLETLGSIGSLGWVRLSQGRSKEAAELLEEGMSTCRRALGEGNETMLGIIRPLGSVYVDLGRYGEAEKLYLRGIPIARRVLGEKHNVSLFMMGGLGATYAAQGRYDKAERQFLDVLRLRDGVWDDDDALTLRFKSFLAGVYTEQKRYEQAERVYIEILPIQRRMLGVEHRMTLYSARKLAQVYTDLGKYDEAEKLYTEAVETYQRGQNEEYKGSLRCTNGLAALYTVQRRFAEAESVLMEALESSNRTLGEEHPVTLTTMNNLAVVYKKQNRYEEAEPLLLEAVEGRRLKLGDAHPHTLESWNNLIELYEAWGRPEKAAEWRAKLPQTDVIRE